jgi:EAL domain-containing protein (putative c-di-GMP-specific phosphodiesterase class I)
LIDRVDQAIRAACRDDRKLAVMMLENESDAVIVRTTIDLAHNLGLKVTAEGVENGEIVKVLRDYHCDVAQGYCLSKPLPVPQFRSWLQEFKGLEKCSKT